MIQLQKISLNTNWYYRFAPQSDDYSRESLNNVGWTLRAFSDVPFSKMSLQNVLWLRKWFDLNPRDACVRYFLRSDLRVYPMTIYLRGQAIAHYDNDLSLDVDITDYVSLDDNALILALNLGGQEFIDRHKAELYLQAIYCDDLD